MPRNIAGPLVRGSDLYAREREIAAAWRLLERGSVLLAAPRRYGKSSLMSALQDGPRPRWTVVFVYVEHVETPAQLLTELTAAVLQQEGLGAWFRGLRSLPGTLGAWVRGVVDEVAIGVPTLGEAKLKLRDALRDPSDWRELAEQLLGVVAEVDGDLLIVMDEFPTMLGTFLERDQGQAVQFLRWFQAQRQRLASVHFLLGGSVNIEPLLEELGHTALLNDLQRLAVEPFSDEVAVRFVREVLVQERARFDGGVPRAVVDTIGTGVPFFLQVLVSELLAELRTIAVADVERAYQERVLGPTNRARFAHYATRLRSYGPDEHAARLVLAAVARSHRSTKDLRDVLGGRHATPDRVLVRLEGDYYLTRDGDRWTFHSALLRDWWLRNAPMPEAP